MLYAYVTLEIRGRMVGLHVFCIRVYRHSIGIINISLFILELPVRDMVRDWIYIARG